MILIDSTVYLVIRVKSGLSSQSGHSDQNRISRSIGSSFAPGRRAIYVRVSNGDPVSALLEEETIPDVCLLRLKKKKEQ